jgi:hypothetical protein
VGFENEDEDRVGGDGWRTSAKILPIYSGKNSVSYLFGDASNIECYGLQSFHPISHIVMYKQENAGESLSLRDSRFYYPLLSEASTTESL